MRCCPDCLMLLIRESRLPVTEDSMSASIQPLRVSPEEAMTPEVPILTRSFLVPSKSEL